MAHYSSSDIYQNSCMHSSSVTSSLETMGLSHLFPVFYCYFSGSRDERILSWSRILSYLGILISPSWLVGPLGAQPVNIADITSVTCKPGFSIWTQVRPVGSPVHDLSLSHLQGSRDAWLSAMALLSPPLSSYSVIDAMPTMRNFPILCERIWWLRLARSFPCIWCSWLTWARSPGLLAAFQSSIFHG